MGKKKEELNRLERLTIDNNFWDDNKKAEQIISNINEIKNIINDVESIAISLNEKKEILDMIKIDNDQDLLNIFETELDQICVSQKELEIKTLLNGEFDSGNTILEIHSGAGGVEACDWANMLYRMYLRWCESKRYKYEEIDIQKGEEAGIKSVTILIKGTYSYGYLRGEKGIHRLVRISPFDSNKRRHTSFASVDITPEIDKAINVEINEEDLKIDVYRSGGAGGQSVNTTDSAVRITHIPSKTVVTCQNERSQAQNKEKATQILKSKLYMLEVEKQEEKISGIKGAKNKIDFGSQIRSYVMHPYSMVKDHRTENETSDVYGVLDGKIDNFIRAYLKGVRNE